MDLSALTLHQLRIFHAVARSGNLTRAAEQLGISQPAVSIQVKQLERILGLPLLESAGRTQKLTDLGSIVDRHAVQVLNEVDQLGDAVMEIRGIEGGRLTVGADTTVGIYVMPPLLGAWHRQFRQVEVDLRVGNHDSICRLLRNNEVDFAVVSTIPDVPGLNIVEFLPNRLVVIAPPDHRLARPGRNAPLPMSILAEEPILIREGGSSTSAAVDAFCRAAGLKPRVAMRLGSIGAIKQGVAGGLGLGVVSERAIGNELAVGALTVLDVEGFPLELTWHIVHFREKRLAPSARSFKSFLEDARRALAEPGAPGAAAPALPSDRTPAACCKTTEHRGLTTDD
jgi:LysR family transcriptional regulator, low CO2-responsive transcriptional regulator